MGKTWNVCMIGMGYWSDVHFRAWQSLNNVRIAAIVDRNQPKLDAKAQMYGLNADQLHLTLEEALLQHPEIEIVDVITRPDSHKFFVEIAARAGKQVLCQKPFAPTIEECQAMVDICNEQGVRLMVAEGWRWQAHYLKIKELLAGDTLGKVAYVKITAKWFFSPRFEDRTKMTQPYFQDMDRLLLYEMGPHFIDCYRFLFGEPAGLTATYKRISPYIKGDDLAILIMHHADMTGMLEASWASLELRDGSYNLPGGENLMEYVLIEGDKASLRLTSNGYIQLIYADGRVEEVPYSQDDMQRSHNRLHRHFVEGLESGTPFATSGEEYMKTMNIIEIAYRIGKQVEQLG